MRDFWYPVVWSKDLPRKTPRAVELLGDPLVLFRDEQGAALCLLDRCPHRSAPLSGGRVRQGHLECPYHGWRFDGGGRCVLVPTLQSGQRIPRTAEVPSYPCTERQGLIWVWPGQPDKADVTAIPLHAELQSRQWRACEGYLDMDVQQDLVMENLLDPAHLPFTHEGTLAEQADAQPISIDVLEEQPVMRASVRRHSHPLEAPGVFTFIPPCTVRMDFQQAWHWRQILLFHCAPLTPLRTRLFYRMSRNWFLGVPLLDAWVRRRSLRILDQDVRMLTGQQKRVSQGARPWGCAVPADAMALRYRKWRRDAEKPWTWFTGFPATLNALPTVDPSVTSTGRSNGHGASPETLDH